MILKKRWIGVNSLDVPEEIEKHVIEKLGLIIVETLLSQIDLVQL